MTDGEQAVVLYEPLSDAFQSDRLRAQAASLGFHGHDLLGWARRHERWGIKEVLAGCIRAALEWRPEHVILMVRDLRHVALSTFETNQRIPWDLDIRRRLIESAGVLMEVLQTWPPDRLTVCRYEAFVSDPAYREALRRRIGWPTLGDDVGRGLATWLERPHEAERHQGRITANSVRYRGASRDAEALRFADEVAEEGAPFNERFGYPP